MKTFIINEHDFFNKRNTPRGFVDSCYHSGDCEPDVRSFMDRFEVPNKEYLKDFLNEFGAWDETELSDHELNKMRLLWIMAGDIQERGEFIYSH